MEIVPALIALGLNDIMVLQILKSLFGERSQTEPVSARRRLDLGHAPPQYVIYAIGDVHGCLDLLRDAETRIAADLERRNQIGLVVFLGDYVDRGLNSAGVLSHLRQPSEKDLRRVILCGNHDDVFSDLLGHPDKIMDWLSFGGRETLMSYGIDIQQLLERGQAKPRDLARLIADAVPEQDFIFTKSLPVSLRVGSYLFVHAGIRPGVDLYKQSDEDLMWIREPFLTTGSDIGLTVIHGHTPSEKPSIGPQRIGIDTKAYATGKLTVLRLDGDNISIL